MSTRLVLDNGHVSENALAAIENFHSGIVKKVKDSVGTNKVVIVGMAMNPVVKKARQILDEQRIEYQYLEFGNYFSAWKERLAIKIWSGWPTFPQIFVKGVLVGGCSDMEVELKSGDFQKRMTNN